jgi:hypothetical protein
MVLLARLYQFHDRQKYALGAPMERSAEHRTTDGRPRVRGVRCTALLLRRPTKRRGTSTVLMVTASGAGLHINHYI